MAPFKKSVCYYYKGKIFNRDNDSILQQIRNNSHILKFAEDDKGDILILENDQLHLVSGQKVNCIRTIHDRPIEQCLSISKNLHGGFLVVEGNDLYEFSNGNFHLLFPINVRGFTHSVRSA